MAENWLAAAATVIRSCSSVDRESSEWAWTIDMSAHQHGELLRVRRGLLVHLRADPPRAGQPPVSGAAARGGAELGPDGVAVDGGEEAEEGREGGAPLPPLAVVAGAVGGAVRVVARGAADPNSSSSYSSGAGAVSLAGRPGKKMSQHMHIFRRKMQRCTSACRGTA